ncbi:MAG: respiratory nitrate reductase subunit gamma [Thermoanaerobaculia bacterium]
MGCGVVGENDDALAVAHRHAAARSVVRRGGAPLLLKIHLAGAWVTLALIPFTRLAHMFALPLQYLWRRPQKVVWATKRTTLSS